MPFAVFRQHQRKLLAVFAIMAMIGFVLSDTLPRWINGGGVNNEDYVVAELFDRPVRRSDLAEMDQERQRANRFMAYIGGDPRTFGGTTQAELIDAMILKKEADRLQIPETSGFARRWIDQQTNSAMTAPIFEMILSKFDSKVAGEELLINLAGQIRILLARQEIAMPVVTPLDVFQNFKDQTERASFRAVPFLVDSFTRAVAEPPAAEVQALYDQGKDLLPDPLRVAPGFKVPRKVKVEFVSIDSADLARKIEAKLPEAEVAAYYEGRKKDFPMDLGLPEDLFLGEPNLTPPRYLPFAEQKDSMTRALAKEKADEEVADIFGKVRDEAIDAYADKYLDVQAEIADARKENRSTEGLEVPKFEDLAAVAKKYGLSHEISPPLTQEEAEKFGRIAMARTGSGRLNDGADFDHTLFASKTNLFEGIEFNDTLGDRYLARKLSDEPAHIAPLSEVRDQVVRAWKIEKARPLARKAAEEYAAKLRSEGGMIKSLTVDDRPVLAIDNVTKLKSGMPVPSQVAGEFRFERGPATPTEIRQIPEAGPKLLDSLFARKAGEVAVEPDRPETTFYVMALDSRQPASYMALMGPSGAFATFGSETRLDVMRKSYTEGMARLREQAKYKETRVGTLVEEAAEGSSE